MGKLIDLTGRQFGKLKVVKRVKNDHKNNAIWLCQCECGKNKIVNGRELRGGDTQSCGCLFIASITKPIHGHRRRSGESSTYSTYRGMKERCNNPNQSCYKHYGGRGIKVCEKWRKFEGFLQDMGERPPGKTIDRINNDGDYCPENCRWITNEQQQKNTQKTILVTINNETLCVKDWCKKFKLEYGTILARIHRLNNSPSEVLENAYKESKTTTK